MWRTDWVFTAEKGITLVTTDARRSQVISEKHFTGDQIRALLKHLRTENPHREYKSEVWHYYGKNYTIKSRLKGWE